MFYHIPSSYCYCADEYANLTPGACSENKFRLYAHSAAAQASKLSRRDEMMAVVQRRREEETHQFCPSGLTPCRIPDSDDGYEVCSTPFRRSPLRCR